MLNRQDRGSNDGPTMSGPIVFGTVSEDFVILGADRLWSNHGTNRPYQSGFNPKIKLHHRRLPIAVATLGLRVVPKHRETTSRCKFLNVKVYVRYILKKINVVNFESLKFFVFVSEYKRLILPGVIQPGTISLIFSSDRPEYSIPPL